MTTTSTEFEDLFQTADELLALEVEELGRVVLEYIKAHADAKGVVSRFSFASAQRGRSERFGRQKHDEVCQALQEAWSFLDHSGLIGPLASAGAQEFSDRYVVTRNGQAINTIDDWTRFLNAQRLPGFLLHPLVLQHAYPNFLRGAYDAAVMEAFKRVEIHVRDRAALPANKIGVELMGDAFGTNGALRDKTVHQNEADGTANVFRGAMGLWRNPIAHRHVGLDHVEAGRLLSFASTLLGIVDDLKVKLGRP